MLQNLENYIRMTSQNVTDYRARPCYASVLSVNLDNYTAQVQLQPSGQTTPYLPILTHWAGNGWGMVSPPPIGAQVFVHFLEDDINSGVVHFISFNNIDKAIQCAVGELLIKHQSGSILKLHNDGSIEINGNAQVNILSPVITAGATETVKKLVTETFVALFNGHTHGDSPPPDQSMGAAQLTDNFGAS